MTGRGPGDIVATGMPEGVSPLHPGDVVEIELVSHSRLRDPVVGAGEGRTGA